MDVAQLNTNTTMVGGGQDRCSNGVEAWWRWYLFVGVLEGDEEVALDDLVQGVAVTFMDEGAEAEDELQAPLSGQPEVAGLRLPRRGLLDD